MSQCKSRRPDQPPGETLHSYARSVDAVVRKVYARVRQCKQRAQQSEHAGTMRPMRTAGSELQAATKASSAYVKYVRVKRSI